MEQSKPICRVIRAIQADLAGKKSETNWNFKTRSKAKLASKDAWGTIPHWYKVGGRERHTAMIIGLEAPQRCFSYRAVLSYSDIVSKLFRACFIGCRTIIARYVAKWGISLCVKRSSKGGYRTIFRVVSDVWEKDVWDFQAKSGSSGFCRLFPRFEETRSSKNVWESTWKFQTSFFQTSAALWILGSANFPAKASRDMGYRNIARYRDMRPLRAVAVGVGPQSRLRQTPEGVPPVSSCRDLLKQLHCLIIDSSNGSTRVGLCFLNFKNLTKFQTPWSTVRNFWVSCKRQASEKSTFWGKFLGGALICSGAPVLLEFQTGTLQIEWSEWLWQIPLSNRLVFMMSPSMAILLTPHFVVLSKVSLPSPARVSPSPWRREKQLHCLIDYFL